MTWARETGLTFTRADGAPMPRAPRHGNLRGHWNETPLHRACLNGKLGEWFLGVLENPGHVDAKDMFGSTPLHNVALCKGTMSVEDNVKIAEFLFLRHVNVNATDNKQRTPLHLAAKEGRMEMVQTLLEHGADPLPLTIRGKTAAELAIKYDHVPVAAMIQAESVRRDRAVAFAMGVHERLGYKSSVVPMDTEIMRKILGCTGVEH
jgi:ankyrin repeat protein